MTVTPSMEFDRAFQRGLVRALFQAGLKAKDILGNLDPAIFDSAGARWLVDRMRWATSTLGAPLDPVVARRELQKAIKRGRVQKAHAATYEKLIQLCEKPVPKRSYYLTEAWEYARFVQLREFIIRQAGVLAKGREVVQWDRLYEDLDKQRKLSMAFEDGDLGQKYFSDVKARIKRRRSRPAEVIPTGTPIDSNMNYHGMERGQLGCIVAPPGRGKTAVLVCLSIGALELGHKVLYISNELNADLIAERFDAGFSQTSIGWLTKKPWHVRNAVANAGKLSGGDNLRIKHYDAGSMSMSKLRGYLARLESDGFYPDVIVLDYADNMDISEFRGDRGGGDNDYGPLGKLYVQLKGLAGERNCVLWTASQANRSSLEAEVINIQHLADSFAKAMPSDVMVAVCQSQEEFRSETCRLFFAKNRNGTLNVTVLCKFVPRKMILKEA